MVIFLILSSQPIEVIKLLTRVELRQFNFAYVLEDFPIWAKIANISSKPLELSAKVCTPLGQIGQKVQQGI